MSTHCTPVVFAPDSKVCPFVLQLIIAYLAPDVKAIYPELSKKWMEWYDTFVTPAAVPGQTAVYLATGSGKDVLKGRYFDCEQDIDFVVRQGRKKMEAEDLYNLKVEFIGLTNDRGTAPAEWEEGNRK